MKKINSLLLMVFMIISNVFSAQTSTETFETESNGSSSFTDNGVIFNIISHVGKFDVQGNFPGTGWSGTANDNRYIDNSNDVANPPSFSIKTTSNLFKVNRFWMYLSALNLDLNVAGTLTVTGKLSGVTKFTQTKTNGFATSLGLTNGYKLIDMTNLNGQNYSNIVIDELLITLGGNFRYAGLDAFTWVKDSNIVIDPNILSVSAGNQINVSCNGGSNGSATVNVSGGQTPYTYSWSPNGGTSATANGLAAGNYTVTVKDANNTTKSQSFTIKQPAALFATTSKTDVSCNGGSNGSASVSASGGTPGYTYIWSPYGGTNATATGLAVGTYAVTIRDTNGCEITKNITINQPTVLTATTSKTDVNCNGGANGSGSVSVSGGTPGYTYSWSPVGGSSATATGLVAGSYTVTITDANGCTIIRSFIINQPNPVSAPTGSTEQSFNAGEAISVLAVNGQNIKWYATQSNAENHINILPNTTLIVNNTTYYATQTIGGCESSSALAVKAYNATLGVVNYKKSEVIVYPNPVKHLLNLRSEKEIHKVIIMDMQGNKIIEKEMKGQKTFDVKTLPKGVYLINVITDETKSIKFIKN